MHKCIHMIVYNLPVPQLDVSVGKRLITPIIYCLIFKNFKSTFFRANLYALRTSVTKKKMVLLKVVVLCG